MEKKLALLISYVFHPLWMPFYMVLLLFWMNTSGSAGSSFHAWRYIFLVVIINSLILPVFVIWLMKKMGIIEKISLELKQDRIISFIITAIFYLTTWFVFHQLKLISSIDLIFMISAILVLMAMIITNFWKISVHSISMGAVSAVILYLTISYYLQSVWMLYFVFLLSGFVGFARLKLKSHSPEQIYVGFAMGFLVLSIFVWSLIL